MTSDRAYRKALSHDIAISEINRCGGSQFDPEFAHCFLESIGEFHDEGRSLEEFPDVRETRSGLMAPRR
jgi:HD-GYP domain-containing protein (c-di-GMP phosphodiesterase class II)